MRAKYCAHVSTYQRDRTFFLKFSQCQNHIVKAATSISAHINKFHFQLRLIIVPCFRRLQEAQSSWACVSCSARLRAIHRSHKRCLLKLLRNLNCRRMALLLLM